MQCPDDDDRKGFTGHRTPLKPETGQFSLELLHHDFTKFFFFLYSMFFFVFFGEMTMWHDDIWQMTTVKP